MESQPQNSEFRNNPENFQPWVYKMLRLKAVIVAVVKKGRNK